jgi:hypothetical protein
MGTVVIAAVGCGIAVHITRGLLEPTRLRAKATA